jgi:hypothetical protein
MEEELRFAWPEGADILVQSGVPGKHMTIPGIEPSTPFPTTTTDTVKILRQAGLKVEYEVPRAAQVGVGYKANDWWIPILMFAWEAAANGAGDLLAAAIREQIGPARLDRTTLHLKVGRVKKGTSKVEVFESHGPPDKVLEAMQLFLRGPRD